MRRIWLGAMLPAAMVARDVAEGRLVMLAKPTHMETFAYYLVYPQGSAEDARVLALRDWLRQEAGTLDLVR